MDLPSSPSFPILTAAALRRRQTRYRDTPTHDLLAEREALCWLLAELETDTAADPASWDFPDQSRSYLAAAVEEAEAELAWRWGRRCHPSAPAWPVPPPDRRAEYDEIKRRLPLAEFVEQHAPVTFARRGTELVCSCPLPGHDDGTPSFHVNPDKQLFHCFGCLRSGDLFSFVRHFLGLPTFGAAADLLALECGVAPHRRPAGPLPASPARRLRAREVARA